MFLYTLTCGLLDKGDAPLPSFRRRPESRNPVNLEIYETAAPYRHSGVGRNPEPRFTLNTPGFPCPYHCACFTGGATGVLDSILSLPKSAGMTVRAGGMAVGEWAKKGGGSAGCGAAPFWGLPLGWPLGVSCGGP